MNTPTTPTTYRYYSMRTGFICEVTLPAGVQRKLYAKYERMLSSDRTLIPRYNNADEFIEDWLSVHY